ncbi:DNA-processing protein DprA [Paenibacillus physcomitrellae]|uniref:DNA processing protein DprA n=1 Tax=Paenibacillus physcomitrellae TaxID=1619311 RepID=A0ABQ1GAC8_9BACL|nr:DNA-processing protein DprA [Paenibacillus physcomitrellae]GGA39831.1 DNA processing protein DprA [Paenibacillus physcomitrellae]
MDKRELLIALNGTKGIGWKTISRLMEQGDLREVEHFDEAEWGRRGVTPSAARNLKPELDEQNRQVRKKLMEAKGIIPVTIWDEEYPILLKEISQPPWVLYTIGRIELLSSFSIAMVGTRVPTAYGRKMGESLAGSLAEQGVNVISGLARGIDGVCHQAALRAAGATTAVLGTAVDQPYPPENRFLYKEIAEKGLIVSEYPIGTPPHPGLFPQRNRIIAGLTRGTVVVEADERSGSLITADAALEANRDVFAVPGPVTSPKSRGTLNLIKQGAKLITHAEDVLEEYGFAPAQKMPEDGNKLTEDEQRIYHMLEQGNRSFDELLTLSGWEFGLLHSVLLSLIIKKQAVQLPGSIYKLI